MPGSVILMDERTVPGFHREETATYSKDSDVYLHYVTDT